MGTTALLVVVVGVIVLARWTADTFIAPPATVSLGELGEVTMPPVDVLASGPAFCSSQCHAPPSPLAPFSAVRLMKCTVLR